MQIRNLYILITVVSLIVLSVLLLDLFRMSAQHYRSQGNSNFSREISATISQLNILADSYILFHDKRSYEQWIRIWGKLQNQLLNARHTDNESLQLISSLQKNNQKIKNLFDRTVSASNEITLSHLILNNDAGFQEKALASQLLNMFYIMGNKAGQLYTISQSELERIHDLYMTQSVLTFSLMAAMLVLFLAIFFIRIIRPITSIKNQLKSFNPNQPEQELFLKNRDEMGEMVKYFNQVTRNLKAVLVSREVLQNEIEARKRTEQNLNTFFEQPLHLHLVIGFDGHIQRANSAWEATLGYSMHEMEGVSIIDLIHPEDIHVMEAALNSLKRGESIHGLELRCVSAISSIRHLMWSASPSIDDSLTYIIATDITEQLEAVITQERLQRELHQSQKMDALGKLTGGIAHDFNNMLAIVLGNIELAKELYENGSSDLIDYLDEIESASVRARDLIAKLMIFSRADKSNTQAMELVPMVMDDIRMLRSILPSSMVINFENQPDLPMVEMDPVRLQQILMNICLNAKDAMKGNGSLTITLRMVYDVELECSSCHQQIGGDWVELSISDTGKGMTTDQLTRIFEPFFTTKDVDKGTGMGLAVVDGAVKNMGGHIIVQSEVGKGTIFCLLFPPLTKSDTNTIDDNKYKAISV